MNIKFYGNAVLLYTGRWYIGKMRYNVQNHLENIIKPYNVDVVIIISKSQLFCGDEHMFSDDVKKQFGNITLKLKYFNKDVKFPLNNTIYKNLTFFKKNVFKIWFYQFNNLRRALMFAGPEYSYYIRARIDTILKGSFILPHTFNTNTVITVPTIKIRKFFTPKYNDWFYVASYSGMTAVSDTNSFNYNLSQRCFGICPEEQVEYHIIHNNYSILPYYYNMTLIRFIC